MSSLLHPIVRKAIYVPITTERNKTYPHCL